MLAPSSENSNKNPTKNVNNSERFNSGMKEMFDKKGRPRVSRECVRRECSDLCLNRSPPIVIYTGCWRDHIVGEGVPSYGDVGKIMLHVQHHDDMYAELDGEWEASLYETTDTDTDPDAETEIVVAHQPQARDIAA